MTDKISEGERYENHAPDQSFAGSVFISLGDRLDLGIDPGGHLILLRRNWTGAILKVINLGAATEQRISDLQHFLQQLKPHAVDK